MTNGGGTITRARGLKRIHRGKGENQLVNRIPFFAMKSPIHHTPYQHDVLPHNGPKNIESETMYRTESFEITSQIITFPSKQIPLYFPVHFKHFIIKKKKEGIYLIIIDAHRDTHIHMSIFSWLRT